MSSRCELPIAQPRLADVIEQGGPDPTLGERAAFVAPKRVRLQLSDGLRGCGLAQAALRGPPPSERHRQGLSVPSPLRPWAVLLARSEVRRPARCRPTRNDTAACVRHGHRCDSRRRGARQAAAGVWAVTSQAWRLRKSRHGICRYFLPSPRIKFEFFF